MALYRVRLLGSHGIATPAGEPVDFPFGKPFALLSYLLITARPAARAELAQLLWPERPRERGLQSVRQALWVIRRTLGESVLEGEDPVAVRPEVVASDLGELREAVAAGELERIHELWQGAPLERFLVAGAPVWEDALEETRRTVQHDVAFTLAGAADRAINRGDLEAALRHLEKACEVQPYAFELRVRRIELLLRSGRAAEAEQAWSAARLQFDEPEFAGALEQLGQRVREARAQARTEAGSTLAPELTGRAEELARLAGLWSMAQEGRVRRLLLRGDAGVGKTRLTQELARIARADGGRVVVVRPTHSERELAWGAITTLVGRLLDLPGAAGISSASDSVLRRLVPSRAREQPPETKPEPAALADALADLIGAVAYESPLLLVLDDVQWLDAPSGMLLGRLASHLEGEAVLLLSTVRETDLDADQRRALERHLQAGGVGSLVLENFTRAETGEFLTFNGGLAPDAPLADRLHQLSGGNPGRLVESLGLLRARGCFVRQEGRLVLDPARVPDPLELPLQLPAEARVPRRRWWRLGLAGAAVLLVALAASWLVGEAGQPRYGGGTVYVLQGDSLLVARPPSAVGRSWRVQSRLLPSPPLPVRRGPFVTADGELHWFVDVNREEGSPYVAELFGDSLGPPLAIGSTDHNVRDLSPDGRYLLISRDRPLTDAYDVGLVRAHRDGSAAVPLLETAERLTQASWAPDGLRIAAVSVGALDTVSVLTPRGRRVGTYASRRIYQVAWCTPGRLLVLGEYDGTLRILEWHVQQGQRRVVPGFEPAGDALACAPDGRHALALGAVDGEMRFVVVELASGAVRETVPLPLPAHADMVWTRGAEPIPRAVVIPEPVIRLRVGEQRQLRPLLEYTDGRRLPVRAAWSSADGSTAAVFEEGVVVGNRVGSTRVRATYGDWLEDSVLVVVSGESAGEILLDEPFAALDTLRWITWGEPAPSVVQDEDSRVLSLNGDGNFLDGLVSRDSFRLPQGATLEAEFRLRPTRSTWQHVQFELCALTPPAAADARHRSGAWTETARIGVAYPANELSKADFSEVLLWMRHYYTTVRVPDILPTDRWVHVALEVRPDGFASLDVDRRRVLVSRIRDPEFTRREWRICLAGQAVGTRALLRNLRLWPGVRHTGSPH